MDVGNMTSAMTNAYQHSRIPAEERRTKDASGNEKVDAKKAEIQKTLKNNGVTETEEYGKTIGEPTLSEKASKYYEELRSKFGDMDFVLVANDSIEGAEKKAMSSGNGGKTIVLIDAQKIERMAADEQYRKKYEGIITRGRDELAELAKQMSGMKSVRGFGMKVGDDGKVSFFAVSQKNNEEITEQQAKKRAEKKAKVKADAKKASAKKAQEDRLEKRRQNQRTNDAKETDDPVGVKNKEEIEEEETFNPDNYDVLEADSVEELMKLVSDREFMYRSDHVITQEESMIGGNIDFAL